MVSSWICLAGLVLAVGADDQPTSRYDPPARFQDADALRTWAGEAYALPNLQYFTVPAGRVAIIMGDVGSGFRLINVAVYLRRDETSPWTLQMVWHTHYPAFQVVREESRIVFRSGQAEIMSLSISSFSPDMER